MITQTDVLPVLTITGAELTKIYCLYDCYKGDGFARFFMQDGGNTILSLTDGNMVIYRDGGDSDELRDFVTLLSPACVYSDLDTLTAIGLPPDEVISVYGRFADITGTSPCDDLSSAEIYKLLDAPGLSLPDYEYFAVDYCRRLNHGGASVFALRDKCAAVSFHTGDFAVMNGLASHAKGYGSTALTGILQKNFGRTFYVCCRKELKPFYERAGFKEKYHAGYWVKNR